MAQLSDRYASALFALSVERGKPDEYLKQAVVIRDTLRDNDWQSVIMHPKVTKEQRCAFFDSVFKKIVHDDFLGFLHLAVANDREKNIIAILNTFIEVVRRHQRIITAVVQSAVPLTEEQSGALRRVLSNKLNKKVELKLVVDPSLIAGVRIQADGYYMDKTLSNQLSGLKAGLKGGL